MSCYCQNLLNKGHEATCDHHLRKAVIPLLIQLGYEPHTYPAATRKCKNRYFKRDGESTLFIDLDAECNPTYTELLGLRLRKWREVTDSQGFVKTAYGSFRLTKTSELFQVQEYLSNCWYETLINKQSAWEELFKHLEKSRNSRTL